MQTLINLQKNYTLSEYNYQFKLPFEMEVLIPDDDPVRLLNAFVEELELSDLYQSYGEIRSSQVTPRQMFKIVIYAAMNRTMRPLPGSFLSIFPNAPKKH